MRKSVFKHLATACRRLARDNRGNTMAIVAGAIIPLTAVIGGGLDIARAHLAQSRLSQACDAAALAGRRAMSNEDIETAKPEATKFFNFNFPQGYMGTAAFTPTITHPDVGTVKVVAATTVPTTIMKIFSRASIPINVDCDATQNFDNIDIVLVLDVTGSMDNSISGEKKIVSLRKAVMALYDELAAAQAQLTSQGLRLRYAIVPYSTNVNVGKLVYAANPSYFQTSPSYQTRWPKSGGGYNYGSKSWDVTSYLAGTSVNVKNYIGGSNNNATWNGCIEERQTVSTITPTSSTAYPDIPTGAIDLNIDKVPDGNANTKWVPSFPKVIYDPDGSYLGDNHYCPVEAKRLNTMSRTDMQNYVNGLTPTGNTYHDIGMIWGARFISRGGIFAADNPSTFNDRPVNRYVIFMTDGILEPDSAGYYSYGVEKLDRRIVGGTYNTNVTDGNGSNLEKRHTARWLMACNAAKQGGASIWSIGFGSSVPSALADCASNDDQVAVSTNSTELIAKFKEIGKNIGALRLSK
ncbi:TadE/TadG family protein [Sphingomonas daechungensis]|uniref:TadE/TadG family protein n=1 Tax=Sphingomonas daechungensis TaxID=1176646 RepID=A0ABX6T1W8_9SPHN|nr:pilus assembly protein [Sphingomonas daechungensis]QNP43213.1 TadE/TadG family protein [Sphingomonas daechungensis]